MPVDVKLPDGQSATLRTSEELSNKDVKVLRRAARRVGLVGQKLESLGLDDLRQESDNDDVDDETKKARNAKALAILSSLDDSEDDTLDLFQRVATVVRLLDWTVTNGDGQVRPLPTTPEEVDDLPRPIYAALTKAAADLDLSEDFSMDGIEDPSQGTADSDG